jgi:hypothetical protein
MSMTPRAELGMRVSDADRADVADRLSRHYSDGRLDQAEFDERLDLAMRAKTRADLIGLLADLPEEQPAAGAGAGPGAGATAGCTRRQQRQLLRAQLERERLLLRHERREHRRRERELRWGGLRSLAPLAAIIAFAVLAGIALRHIFSVWLVIGVLAVLWLLHRPRPRRP